MPRKAPAKIRTLSAPVYHGPIPKADGPKLEGFRYSKAPITFRALLSDPDTEGQAHVFEVEINSKIYALKIFKIFDHAVHEFGLHPYQKDLVSLDTIHAHLDPFYNECRAYGRLKETNLDGEVAVRCHGYVILPATLETELEKKYHLADWDRDDYDKPIEKRAAFRAIVKDLVQDDVPLSHQVVKKMKKDLLQIRKQGVYPSDIKPDKYRGGLLVGFSNAITEPHYLFDIKPDWRIQQYKDEDLYQFDYMVQQENVKTWIRAMPLESTLRKLRRRDQHQEKYRWSTESESDFQSLR